MFSDDDPNLTLNTDGSFIYTPTLNFFGDKTFEYKVNDGTSDSVGTSRVTLTINPINDIPLVSSTTKSYTFDEDATFSKSAADTDNLLEGASDVDGDALTVVLATDNTTDGNLTFNADGSFNFSPVPNFFGANDFSYTVTDGEDFSETVTVTLNMQAVNDAPIPSAASYTFSITELATGGDAVGTISALDIEGDGIVYSLSAGDISLFEIDPTTGAITVKGIFPFDFETNQAHTLTATVTDDGSPLIASTDAVSYTHLTLPTIYSV